MAGQTLEYTPTWIVAAMCSFIVLPSLVAERCLHYLSKAVRRRYPKPLYKAFLTIKRELLQGLIALLLTLLQRLIQKTCISPRSLDHMLPCLRASETGTAKLHYVGNRIVGRFGSRMLTEQATSEHCRLKGKVPLLSNEVMIQLQIFIFVLAVTHVTFSVSTMLLGVAKIRQWKQWEAELPKHTAPNGPTFSHVRENPFIKKHSKGFFGQEARKLRWLHSFLKQFYGSVTKIDYTTMRLSFINAQCSSNPDFDFHGYMMRILQNDFKKVVGISWYMWIFVVLYLLLNVNGWHAYFWISFLPLLLLLAVGTKLQYIICELAQDVTEKQSVIQGDLVVKPSDDLFWFGRPRLILDLIHFILFQNAFEIAFFFWILITNGFNSCIMGPALLTVPRLVIGFIIQVLCSYSILPVYVIVTQMGSCFQKEIFHHEVRRGLQRWAQTGKIKRRDIQGTAEPTNTSGDLAGPSTEMTSPTVMTVATQKPVGEVVTWPGHRTGARARGKLYEGSSADEEIREMSE